MDHKRILSSGRSLWPLCWSLQHTKVQIMIPCLADIPSCRQGGARERKVSSNATWSTHVSSTAHTGCHCQQATSFARSQSTVPLMKPPSRIPPIGIELVDCTTRPSPRAGTHGGDVTRDCGSRVTRRRIKARVRRDMLSIFFRFHGQSCDCVLSDLKTSTQSTSHDKSLNMTQSCSEHDNKQDMPCIKELSCVPYEPEQDRALSSPYKTTNHC
ncbi:hypothetical protein OBBRIDRAFT_40053 [Obba rivulosa]|uniref:Uncharacterized protein n=1 Tax=Obba rivulosa TaxID=1052685 RepID=A0A8E2B0T7_9APHY|nr:hypothetical protein OBBRIDRAFT_40053 [Obba rivulosa]